MPPVDPAFIAFLLSLKAALVQAIIVLLIGSLPPLAIVLATWARRTIKNKAVLDFIDMGVLALQQSEPIPAKRKEAIVNAVVDKFGVNRTTTSLNVENAVASFKLSMKDAWTTLAAKPEQTPAPTQALLPPAPAS